MKEYEYSFKVNSLEKCIDYCKQNNYKLIENTKQSRTLYKNSSKIMARITVNDKEKKLDFKEDNLSTEILKIRKESLPLKFDDIKAVESILDILEYQKYITLIRTRIVYEKDSIKFELDKYESPEKYCVVAIEGKKEEVDKIYQDIEVIYENNND